MLSLGGFRLQCESKTIYLAKANRDSLGKLRKMTSWKICSEV